ncbi:MAG: cytochrome c maturation protein CcmE [Anaerolineales bacterium]|nr:cytochrome c maturation protein CcmE [Anaerolineales bacterium]MCX7756153.1 cytochrome c maturation protein CcmE [Anaerolineales bacterium]MDW8277629.1 cytochrome c maturation protein CcmE [Anaerolineales bacterium]
MAQSSRIKFILGGALILAAVVYLIVSSTQASAQYFMTIEELNAKGQSVIGKNVRVSGAVLGESIQYDPQSLTLRFTVAHVTADNREIEAQGGLAEVLYQATIDPNRPRIQVVYHGPKPDLLRNEAQAIMTGKMGEDGIFYAEELLLKCPTRYEEAVPAQTEG